jgi:hypothetical protein
LSLFRRTLLGKFLLLHKLGLRLGIQLIPDHYYSSVSNIEKLKETRNIWAKKSELPGISYDIESQVSNIRSICARFMSEYMGNLNYKEAIMRRLGPGFGYIEAQALHSVVRYYKPESIIEIGSGVSTFCSLKALEANYRETGYRSDFCCIEPNPSKGLRSLEEITIVKNDVQKVPFNVFAKLKKGDLLFVDSSHTVKPGSDVNYIILEILPRLQPGVIVHFHDIFLPYDYQRDILTSYFQWCETSLLRAFLVNNDKVKIIFCLSMLHYAKSNILREIFPEYQPQHDINGLTYGLYKPWKDLSAHFPSSIYLEVIGQKRGNI